MKKSLRYALATAATLLALGVFAGNVPAQTGDGAPKSQPADLPTVQLIKDRRARMKELGEHMRAVIAFIKGTAGTPEEVKNHTVKIKAIADTIPTLFPEGSGMDDGIAGITTGAKPEIWIERARFEASARFLAEEAAKLDFLANDADRSAMSRQFMLVGRDGCSGCHEDFRHKLPGTD